MAENQDDRQSEDLTEEPSAYRIEEFRQKGQVAQSRELTGLIALLAAGATLYGLGPRLGNELTELMRTSFQVNLIPRSDVQAGELMRGLLQKSFGAGLAVVLPIAIGALFVGVLSSFAQVGSIFSAEPLKPDLSRIDPFKGLGRVVSLRQFYELLRLLAKLVCVLAIAYAAIKTQLLESVTAPFGEASGVLLRASSTGKSIFLSLCGALLAFAALDFWNQRREHNKQLRLTKQEAKQEHKEREGDPQIRARIRAIQREMSRKRMMAAVRKADVVITNPTHIAIAIVYDRSSMLAPKVVAKGADLIAQKIKAIATEAGVPLVENVPLARTLFKSVKLNQYVPRALYQAVAEVLAYVYRLRNRTL